MPIPTKTRLDYEVTAAALLSTLPSARLIDGREVFCSAAGATHGTYLLDKEDNVSVVDGINVVATDLVTGRWIFQGPPTGALGANISVANEAALTALAVSGLPDGTKAFVRSHRSYWTLRTQGAVIIAHENIASSAAARQWSRILEIPHLTWLLEPIYFVDAVAGDDENVGTTNVTALQSYAEYIRRCPYMYISQTVNILTALPNTDCLVHALDIRWHQALSATPPTLQVVGLRTLGADNVVVASSDELGNVKPLIDLGIALTVGQILQATSGGVSGATAVVDSLVAGTSFRTSPWQSAAFVRVAPPAPGDNVALVTLPTVNAVGIMMRLDASSAAVGFYPELRNLDIAKLCSSMPGGALFDICSFGGANGIGCDPGCIYLFRGCSIETTGFVGNLGQGAMQFRQCAIGGSGAIQWGNGARGEYTNTVLRGRTLTMGATTRMGPITMRINSLGMDGQAAASTALLVERGCEVGIEGTLYGADPGGASTGTNVQEAGHVYVSAAVTPTLTAATELILDGAGTAMPDLLPSAGLVLPAAAALTTWAQWAAGPFTRNVMSYKSPANITNHA